MTCANNVFIRAAASLALAATLIGGCAVKDKLYSPSEAENKLATFCLKEHSNTNAFQANEFAGAFSSTNLVLSIKKAGIKVVEGKKDVDALNDLLKTKDLSRRFSTLELPQEGRLLKVREKQLSLDERKRLNRLILETAFPEECPRSLTVLTRTVENTLWIYIPFNEPIFTVKPSGKEAAEKKNTPLNLLYLGGEFDEKKNFSFEYDIVKDTIPPDPVSYGSGYNEKYAKIRQLVYQGLQESIFNMTPKDSPEFVMLIIADITTGVAIKTTFYLSDLKQFMTEAIPAGEYYLREQNEIVGDDAMIGDTLGKSLKYDGVEWTDFLILQIKTRVKYKLTQSDVSTDSDPDKIIAGCAANTFRFYPFTRYQGLYLYNIRQKRDMLFDKKQLKTFEEETWWANKGKFTTIRFDAGSLKPKTTEKAVTP